ncbi:hypothetical protein GOBAR_AA12179 [Gossypium barbadense]|uniref:Uncharacterized protein n=1 Tax=Gossypium barbadense TaxID=3634 RepID=A0A2P5XYR5_GOSBA|nr:hypothetical protein GOBAR_AA12179 [Gossypium barbadense]
MTVDEVMAVHAVEEEMAASSSSKVETVVKEDHGKENEKEDLSNGTNGKTVREDTDGDGDYVFVNGNEAENGDLVESDLDKNGNGIGVEDQGFESLETKGEVKSKSDLVEKDESCIGIVDQDKESVELCHVEAPVDEQKSGDLVEGGPVSATNAGMADQNGISKLTEDVFVDKNIIKHTVSEAAVVDSSARQSDEISPVPGPDGNGSANDSALDFRSKENEGSEIAVADDGDCSGDGLVNDSVEAPVSEADVLDFRSKESEGSEMTVADDGDCSGDGLVNDSVEAPVSEANVLYFRSKENGGSEMAVAGDGDFNGDGFVNDSVEATVSEDTVLDFRSKDNEDSEMAVADDGDCNGDGLANDNAKATVCEASVINSRSKENEGSEITVADDGDCNGDSLANDSAKTTVSEASVIDSRSKENAGSEMAVADGGDCNANGLSNDSAEATVSEANVIDSRSEEKEGSGVAVAADGDCSGDGLANDSANATVSETNVIDSSSEEKEGSEMTVAADGDYGGDGLPNDSAKATVSGANVEESEVAVVVNGDCSGDGLANGSAEAADSEAAVVTRNEHKEVCDDGVPIVSVPDSNGDCFPDVSENDTVSEAILVDSRVEHNDGIPVCVSGSDTVEDTSEVFKPEQNESEADSPGPVSDGDGNGNGYRPEQNGFSGIAETVLPDVVSGNELVKDGESLTAVDDFPVESGSDLEPNTERDLRMKADIHLEKETANGSLSDECGEALQDVHTQDGISEAVQIDNSSDSGLNSQQAVCKKYGDHIDAAISQERAVRDLHRSKRQEIDSIQSMMNIEDIDAQIRNMEHMIQHETMPLKDEKQFIHQIKQFKQTRERISSSMSKQDEVQQGLDQKDQIKERMKSLKKEADQLKVNLLKAEAVTKAAKKEYHEETEKLNKLQSQFKAADDIRQEAYVLLQSLKKQSYEKNKSFYQYRDDAKAANDLALKGDKEALQNLCVNQVEKFMELWNNNDEFCKEYIRCNTRSTLRRLRTLDGRALGPDEEPPVIPAIPKVVNEQVAKDQTVSSSTLEERTQEKTAPAKAEIAKAKPAAKSMEQKNLTSKSEKPVKSVPPASGSTTASSRGKIEEAEEKPKITKEEEEMARKADESRKEEEAAKLREQRRLEEIAKAKEALERKRRNAEKAQARAALRAQKEAEQKEKEREKRAKKKERRKVAAAGVGDASVTDETESALTLETPAETPKDSESTEKLVTVAKRSQKPPQFTKQSKAKSIPPPLRNRGKRKMQQWMWVLVTSLIVLALFLAGNYNFSFNFGLLQKFNF